MNYSGLNYYGFSIKDVNSHLQRRQEANKKLQIYVTQIVEQNRQYINELRGGIKMIKLSSGVEVSEETVVSALKAAGIRVEPKHIWKTGDVATSHGLWRFIVKIGTKLYAIDSDGCKLGCYNEGKEGTAQEHFEEFGYKFVGRQSDLLKGQAGHVWS